MFNIPAYILALLISDLVHFEGRAEMLRYSVVRNIESTISHSGPLNRRIKGTGAYGLYYDSLGKLTGCIGHLVTTRKAQNTCTNPSRQTVLDLLEADIVSHNEATLNLLRAHKINLDKLPDNVLNAMLHLGFNMGATNLGTFKNTLKQIRLGNYNKAADNLMKSKWASQVGPNRSQFIYELIKG